MHSKLKLALAVMTSPGAAFEEILERKLLGTALFIVALTGLVASIPPIITGLSSDHLAFLQLGKQNPICWFGLFLLYALAVQKLLGLLGTKTDYVSMLIVLGWSQVTLFLAQVAVTIANGVGTVGVTNPEVAKSLVATYVLFYVAYVPVVGIGIHTVTRIPLARGIMTYMVIAIAATIAFRLTYGNARLEAFQGALPGIKAVAGTIVEADQIPWLAASVIGLVLGLWHLGKALNWELGMLKRTVASAGLLGAAILAVYIFAVINSNIYGKVYQAQRAYDRDEFDNAAKQFKSLLPISANNVALIFDIADTYYLAGKSKDSIAYYKKAIKTINEINQSDKKMQLARAYSGIGAVYDFDSKYDQAISNFQKSTKQWPEFRDTWIRMAVTYDRMGDHKSAIKSGKHAVDKLESKAAVPWIALAEAFIQTNDMTQGKASIAMVVGKDPDLAERIGGKAQNWKNAVSKLTREDLKYPMEKEMAPPAKKQETEKK